MTGVLSHSHFLFILILASVLLLYGLAPASAVTSYKPGVKPGDSATYGQVKADWKSDLAPFSPVKDFLGVSSITVSVINIVGTDITARQTYSYPNGTTRSFGWVEDVQSGAGNKSLSVAWIIAGYLVSTDPSYQSFSVSTVSHPVHG